MLKYAIALLWLTFAVAGYGGAITLTAVQLFNQATSMAAMVLR